MNAGTQEKFVVLLLNASGQKSSNLREFAERHDLSVYTQEDLGTPGPSVSTATLMNTDYPFEKFPRDKIVLIGGSPSAVMLKDACLLLSGQVPAFFIVSDALDNTCELDTVLEEMSRNLSGVRSKFANEDFPDQCHGPVTFTTIAELSAGEE